MASRFQQRIGANNVGLDKGCRAVNGAIDVALRCQVHHGVRFKRGEHTIQRRALANVDQLKRVAVAVGDRRQRLQITCVGQAVQHQNVVAGIINDMSGNRRPNEACTTGNDNFHKIL